jgi:hypothetical protein
LAVFLGVGWGSLAVAGRPPGNVVVDELGVPSWANMSWLDNGQIRVGVDLNHGGAVVFLSRAGEKNRINNYDFGRQVQLAFYSGPVPYSEAGQKPAEHWEHLGWNPVQTGDDFGNASRVIAHENDGRVLHVRCVPMQWPLNGVAAECEFDSWLELDGVAVRGRAQITNRRKDRILYSPRLQELPAVYVNSCFYRVVSYTGENPFSGEPISEIPKAPGKHPWSFWMGTEAWAAAVDETGQGVGVITPGRCNFTGGFAGRPGGNETLGNSTAYLAGQAQELIDCDIVYAYDYELVPGSVDEIRARAAQKASSPLPDWVFERDRRGWSSVNGRASGWPVQGRIRLGLAGADPQWLGPHRFWKAEQAPCLIVEGAFRMEGKYVTVFWQRLGEKGPGPKDHMRFEVVGDGQMRRYVVRLGDAESYKGGMVRLRLDPGEGGEADGWGELASVRLGSEP